MKSGILYITHRVPWPPDRGDRIRTWNVLKYLSSRADVDLACFADEPVADSARNALRGVVRQLAVIPHQGRWKFVNGALSLLSGGSVTEGLFQSSEMTRVLSEWDRSVSYDALLASSSGVARYLSPPFIHQRATRWVDLIDVDSQKWLDYSAAAKFPMSAIYRTEGHRLRAVERSLAGACDRLLVVSHAECELFHSFCQTERIQAVVNGVDSDYFCPDHRVEREAHSCVFVGVMNYKPNAEAVLWFARNVWPEIRREFPDAVFRIVGRSPTQEVSSLQTLPGVEVTGAVADVRPWLNRSGCAVVPLQIARGVQNKILEAMSCGVPVVSSSAPLKGLAVKTGTHLLRADSPNEWITAVRRLFTDSDLRRDLECAGPAFVRIHHSWEQCLSSLEELVRRDEAPEADRSEIQGVK